MCIPKKVCPVPYDQQPINEYASLKQSFFFSWSTLNTYKYLVNISIIFCLLFLTCLPFTFSIIMTKQNFLKYFFTNTALVSILFILIFIRLYLGWSYVVKRLVSASIFYEESGWYDGQIWVKTLDSLTKDRLIGTYEVMPLIRRVRYSLILSVIAFVIDTTLLYLI